MRYVKLGLLFAAVALAAIGLLRVTDVIPTNVATWLAVRALAVIAVGAIAGIVIGAISERSDPVDESTTRPVP